MTPLMTSISGKVSGDPSTSVNNSVTEDTHVISHQETNGEAPTEIKNERLEILMSETTPMSNEGSAALTGETTVLTSDGQEVRRHTVAVFSHYFVL